MHWLNWKLTPPEIKFLGLSIFHWNCCFGSKKKIRILLTNLLTYLGGDSSIKSRMEQSPRKPSWDAGGFRSWNEKSSKNLRDASTTFYCMYITPAPSNGWCLNPKGLLNGTLSHPCGTPWRVQVDIYIYISIYIYIYFFSFPHCSSTSHIHIPSYPWNSIVPGSLCPACIGWNPTSAYHESQSRLISGVGSQLTWKTWKLITWSQRHRSQNRVCLLVGIFTLLRTNISHLWKRKIIFPATFKGDIPPSNCETGPPPSGLCNPEKP